MSPAHLPAELSTDERYQTYIPRSLGFTSKYFDIPAIQHSRNSWFIPNCYSIFETLYGMDRILLRNRKLFRDCPHYFSLPVRIYYGVIFYVQVLRAKNYAGALTSKEYSWLEHFLYLYPDFTCPIAGPLVPIFSNIVACLPDNGKFQYTYPEIPPEGTYCAKSVGSSPDATRHVTVYDTHYLFPSIPLLASLLRCFCNLQSLSEKNFEDYDQFVPFKVIEGTDADGFAGIIFQPHNDGTENSTTAALLSNPALSHPLPEYKERLKEIHRFWRNSPARDIPHISATENYNPTTIEDQTLLSGNFEWFKMCVEVASSQARFFACPTYLSQISPVGNNSSLVVANLRFLKHESILQTIDKWYPDIFSDAEATFKATCMDLTMNMKYEALIALTNATINWKNSNQHKIGSLESNCRGGPYFKNTNYTFGSYNIVPVLQGLNIILQTQYFDPHGMQ